MNQAVTGTRKLSDNELHQKLLRLVREEKKLVTQVLHLLKIVEDRRLYCDFGCRSLFDYATKILKYSESEAYCRINAMRLMKELPEIEKSLESGELTLTNAAQAQSFFKRQKIQSKKQQVFSAEQENSQQVKCQVESRVSVLQNNSEDQNGGELRKNKIGEDSVFTAAQKKEVLLSLKNQSTRRAKEILASKDSFGSNGPQKEIIRTLPDGRIEIKFSMDEKAFEELSNLRNYFSKHGEDIGLEELLKRLARKTKLEKECLELKRGKVTEKESFTGASRDVDLKKELLPRAPKKHRVKDDNHTLTPTMRFYIKGRDGYRCKNCGSTKNLEIDHIKPQALGGNHHRNNLQTLCRPCNQRRAIKIFGEEKVVRTDPSLRSG